MRYIPALDGLRALAALMVVAFHADAPGFEGGFIGVDVFFVLSGYLITRVLGENPDLLAFYWRRFKRLMPPLALLVAAFLAVAPAFQPSESHALDAGLALLYLTDYAVAFWDKPSGLLRHTWSLAVEEHFYLLWPVVFLRWRPQFRALIIAYAVAAAWRFGWPDWNEAYYRFDTHASGLILGCLIAGLIQRYSFPAWPGLLVLAAACMTFSWGSPEFKGVGGILVELAAAVAILGSPPAWLTGPALVYVGKLSYGLYLWHYPISRLMRDADAHWIATLMVSLIGGMALSAFSYHTIEAWVRRPRTRKPVIDTA